MAKLVRSPSLTEVSNNRFVWTVSFETDVPTSASLLITGGGDHRLIDFNRFTTAHELPVFGLKVGTEYQIDVLFRDSDGSTLVAARDLVAQTQPAPTDIVYGVLTSNPARMEPGYTVMSANAIVDEDGDLVYRRYNSVPGFVNELEIVSDPARIRLISEAIGATFNPYSIISFGLQDDGRQVQVADPLQARYTIADFRTNPLAKLNHELYLTSDNTLLTFGATSFAADLYPTSWTDPTLVPGFVLEDNPLIEVALDGAIKNIWYMRDILATQRPGLWTQQFEAVDWVHMNTAIEVPGEDAFIVSARNQDAVIKFTRGGDIVWILGDHQNWPAAYQQYLLNPVGADFEWQYAQHAPMLTKNGDILLFDNANYKTSRYSGEKPVPSAENTSRVVRFHVDEDAMTVSQVWQYVPDPKLSCAAVGDADELPKTGNILGDFGYVAFEGGIPSPDLGKGVRHTHVVELTNTPNPEIVFEMEIYSPDPTKEWAAYRAERIPSLYNRSVSELKFANSILDNSGSSILTGIAGNDLILGVNGNDTLRGGDGEDSLSGGAGDDRILGENGDDSLGGASGADTVDGGAGNDRVDGGTGNDSLFGRAGSDTLIGGGGNDGLVGGDGPDRLTGGPGYDRFIFWTASSSPVGGGDTITDFETGIDSILIDTPDNAGTFIGTSGFSGAGGVEARYDVGLKQLQVDLDGNGALGAGDMVIQGVSLSTVTAGDLSFL